MSQSVKLMYSEKKTGTTVNSRMPTRIGDTMMYPISAFLRSSVHSFLDDCLVFMISTSNH